MFAGDPTVTILGVGDVNPWAPGLELARRLDIPVVTDLRGLIADPRLDLIIDVTGSPDVQRTILELKPATTEVMGGASARFVWDLLAERKRSEELEDRYGLMLRELQAQAEGDFIIGQNPKMKELAELIVKVAATPTTVLIRGESGTGKELVARAIHRSATCRSRCRPSSSACCRRARSSPWGTWSLARSGCASSPPPTVISRRRSRSASSGRISSTASTLSPSRFRRCVSGPRTFPCSPITSFARPRPRSTSAWTALPRKPSTSSSGIRGPAIYASSRTSSSAR
ncbi:MAG: hypothetical protein DME16_22135 [Candidatus Rokuibacteriota bacterium]|nr:MAG: hypothetical protein DME16_22135 [Candidatus Rokubacteria bacterium]